MSTSRVLAVSGAILSLLACGDSRGEGAKAPEIVFVALGGQSFQLELALDPATRFRGLSGRGEIARHGGMLFVLPRPRPFAMVMRDCPVPIDVAFLDEAGRVVAIHQMPSEPARGPGESARDYEERLPVYPSGQPVQFAIETAGGRLAQVGLGVGDVVPLDVQGLASRAR